jgi:hypothetical protein
VPPEDAGRDAWVIAGSEVSESSAPEARGDVVIWDLQSREILQRLSAHNGGSLYLPKLPSTCKKGC